MSPPLLFPPLLLLRPRPSPSRTTGFRPSLPIVSLIVLLPRLSSAAGSATQLRARTRRGGAQTDDGELAGRWGWGVETDTVITLPIVGDRNAGTQSRRLVERTWDASPGIYPDTYTWC